MGLNIRKTMFAGPIALGGFIVASVIATSAAQASFILELSDGTVAGTTTITDNGAGDALAATAGVIVFSGTVGTWNVSVTTGFSKPVIGDALVNPTMDISSLVVSGSVGTFTVRLTDTDFFPVQGLGSVRAGIGGNTSGDSVQFKTYLGSDNLPFSTDTPATDSGLLSGPSFSSNVTKNFNPALAPGFYSMTLEVTTVHSAVGQLTGFDARADASKDNRDIPAPASLVLLGSALLGLGWMRRRQTA